MVKFRTTHAALLAVALLAAGATTGCATGLGGDVYQRGQARRAMQVRFATITSVRPVQIEGTKTPVGTVAGAAVGGIAGSTVGGGKGSTIGAVLGAVAGGLAGSAIEEGATRRPGLEITVREDNGRYFAVVQEDGGEGFRAGERVRILSDGGTTRVSR